MSSYSMHKHDLFTILDKNGYEDNKKKWLREELVGLESD